MQLGILLWTAPCRNDNSTKRVNNISVKTFVCQKTESKSLESICCLLSLTFVDVAVVIFTYLLKHERTKIRWYKKSWIFYYSLGSATAFITLSYCHWKTALCIERIPNTKQHFFLINIKTNWFLRFFLSVVCLFVDMVWIALEKKQLKRIHLVLTFTVYMKVYIHIHNYI